jgi:hypothetical protein
MNLNQVFIEPPKEKPKSKNMEGMGDIHPLIPQLPFYCIITGPRHSGKTVLLHNLLSKKSGFYGKSFKPQNIVLYSPTYNFDETLHDLHLKNVYTPPTDPRWVVGEIRKIQEGFRESDNMTGVLLVMEDITQIKDAWKILEELGYTGRHFHIHVLAIAHKMSSIVRGVRTQTQQWILFRPHEESEREWILDVFSRKNTRHIWENAIQRAWNIPYNFVYVDFERKGIENIYRSGFNQPLFTAQEAYALNGEPVFYNPNAQEPQEAKESDLLADG